MHLKRDTGEPLQDSGTDTSPRVSHIDTAQAYRSEAHVGAAVRESGLKREQVFVSECGVVVVTCCSRLLKPVIATKCISKTHGYDSTLRGVDLSLERFALGE